LNSIRVDEELDGQEEEGEQHHHPGEQQHRDLDEILEETDIAHQSGNRLQDRPAGVETDLGDAARAQEVGGRQAGAGGLEAQARKAFENDAGEAVPVADEVGEHADEERLLDESRDDILVPAPRPEQGSERQIDRGQRGGQEADLVA